MSSSEALNRIFPALPGEATVLGMWRTFWPFTTGRRRTFLLLVPLLLVVFVLVSVLPLVVGEGVQRAIDVQGVDDPIEAYLADAQGTSTLDGALDPGMATKALDALFSRDDRLVTGSLAVERVELERLLAPGPNAAERALTFNDIVVRLASDETLRSGRVEAARGRLAWTIALFIGLAVAAAALRLLVARLTLEITAGAARKLQSAVFHKVHSTALIDSGVVPRPGIIGFNGFVDAVESAARAAILSGLPAVMNLVVSLALLWWISPIIGLAMLVLVAILDVVRRMRSAVWSKRSRERLDEATAIGNFVDDSIVNLDGLRTIGALDSVRSSFGESADRLIRARWNVEMTAERLRVTTSAAGQLGLAAVVFGIGMTNGSLDAAAVTAAVLYVGRITESLSQLPGILTKLQDSAPPTRRLERVLATPPMRPDPENPIEPTRGREHSTGTAHPVVEFQAVEAALPGGRHSLDGCTFTAVAGGWTFLVEPLNGMSEVIVALLVGRLSPTAGLVTLAGSDTSRWRSEFFPTYVASVAREPAEFAATVRAHLTAGFSSDATDRDLRSALDRCGLPGPDVELDRVLGSRQRPLNRNERARLALARAMVHPGLLVVVDDPTEGLDTEAASAWWSVARDVLDGRSVIASTRRLELLQPEDRVVVLRNGSVLDIGRRSDLIARGGVFSRWWSASAAGGAWTLGTLPGLDALDGVELASLWRRMAFEQYESGRMICSAGTSAGRIFAVVDGTVELLDDDGQRRALLRPGDHFGELDPTLEGRPMPAARAVEHTVVSSIHRSSLSSGAIDLLERPEEERRLFRWLARHGPTTRAQLEAAWTSVPDIGDHLDSLLALRLAVSETDVDAPANPERFRVARPMRRRAGLTLLNSISNWTSEQPSPEAGETST